MNEINSLLQQGHLPTRWVVSALVLALLSIAMVIAVFYFLNRQTKRQYFTLWSIAWVFYGIYLVAALGLQELPGHHILLAARRACIGVSALFMFWGSFQLTYQRRTIRELALANAVVVAWCLVATFWIGNPYLVTIPFFGLLGAAGVYTGVAYLSRRADYHGGSILGVGFLLWGGHLFAYPLLELSPQFMAVSYVLSAVVAFMIMIGMIVEQQVNVAEKNYRILFDSSSDAVFLVDIWTLKVLEANAAAGRLTKAPQGELIGRSFPEICPSLNKTTGNVTTNQQMFNKIFRPFSEFHIAQGGGNRALCEGDAALAEWRRHLVIQVNVRDVGERKKAGQQLQRAEKLSALGQLVAGVAHELNNPLAVVMGTAQLLARREDLDGATKDEILRIHHQSERASKIVRDLLAYARPAEPQKMAVDINRLVSEVLDTTASELRAADITVRKHLADLPPTMADPVQVEQVLSNLLTNAIHALREKPKARQIDVTTSETTSFLRISIKDNGPGIPAETQKKIFDPFFTTKPLGRGTGLGLTISNTLIQEHHGKIWVESKVGHGAEFFVDFPILACEIKHATPALNPATANPDAVPDAALKQLLIVDDEPDIVCVLKTLLEETGYQVETAQNGVEALQRLSGKSYDVILSDMRMPDVDGATLYARVQNRHPAMANRMIFVTGDTVSENTRTFLQSTGNRWLSKPFHINDVLRTVQEVVQPCSDLAHIPA